MSDRTILAKWPILADDWKRHPVRDGFLQSRARFNVVPAGRRSGKTETAIARGVRKWLSYARSDDGWFVFAAPTYRQAKRIFWRKLKKLCPRWFVADVSESELMIRGRNGATIMVVGMDSPERIEGIAIDHLCWDEYGNSKPESWEEHVRGALSTLNRPGSVDFTGVPEGRNHYYELYMLARSDDSGSWAVWHWKSAEILDPEEVEQARRFMDPLVYAQEYEADFVSFTGAAYYSWDREIHARHQLRKLYEPTWDLHLCFDFNRSPGIAVVVQELPFTASEYGADLVPLYGKETSTCVIGEVHIPRNSNTEKVCSRIRTDWGGHQGQVMLYGDATGGAGGSAKLAGSDWDIVRRELRGVFGSRIRDRVPSSNPRERQRVNAVNSRLQSADGHVRLLVDPKHAPNVVKDFEGVVTLEGGSGEIDKDATPSLTHLTDALGYYVEKRFPVSGRPGLVSVAGY